MTRRKTIVRAAAAVILVLAFGGAFSAQNAPADRRVRA